MRGTLQNGQVLGRRYVIRERLGEGGWGSVYAATQMDLGRAVAIKVLHTDVALSPEGLGRFEREARAAAALGHPNIVQVTDFQAAHGEPPFLVMEHLTGQTLGAVLERTPRLPGPRVAWIAHQILSALEAAHGAGIIHRDVKPDNVFLVAASGVEDFVKLLDFGIAKLADDNRRDGMQMTGAGAMIGSPAYMSPEQIRGTAVDARSDLYALGATMYRALTGALPHEATTLHALMLAITEAPLVPIKAREPSVDPALAAVVERALHKDAAARFRSAAEMRAALEPFTHASRRGHTGGGTAAIPAIGQAAVATTPAAEPRPWSAATPGSPLAGTTGPITPAPVAMPVPYVPAPPPPTYAPPPAAFAPPPAAPEKKSSGAVVGLLAAILVVLLGIAGAVAFFFLRGGGEPPPPSTVVANATDAGAPVVVVTSTATTTTAAPSPGPGVVRPVVDPKVHVVDAGAPPPARDAGAPAAKKQFAGATAKLSGGTYADLPIDPTRAAVGAHQKAIDACYAATEFEPPDHQFMDYAVDVDPAGHARSVSPQTPYDRHARLDACMFPVLRSVQYPASPKGSVIRLSFSARTRDNP